jgi:hypothetical protein
MFVVVRPTWRKLFNKKKGWRDHQQTIVVEKPQLLVQMLANANCERMKLKLWMATFPIYHLEKEYPE